MTTEARPDIDVGALARSLPPGTIGLSTIDGKLGGLVRLGQRFLGADPGNAKWTHTFLVGDGDEVFQAMPAGAERATLGEYLEDIRDGDEVMFVWSAGMSADQGHRAVVAAQALVARHVGYSFLTYVYLFASRLRAWPFAGWLRRRVADTGDMICSQFVDYCLRRAGVDAFPDRGSQDVTPADFAELARAGKLATIAVFQQGGFNDW